MATTSPHKESLKGSPIADTSIKQPVLITMIMLLILVAGFIAYSGLPVNLLPDFDLGIVNISVVYPGAGPDTVADEVAKPIEDAVSTISGVKSVSSTSSENVTNITIQLTTGVDTNQALQRVRENVAAIRASLPQTIDEPVYQLLDPAQSPVLSLAVTTSVGQDPIAARQQIENEILPRIQSVSGVGSTSLTGGNQRQISVLLNLSRLQALRILPGEVSSAISAANANIGLGDTLVGDREFNLRVPSVFSSTADIATVGIGTTGYTVGDVATIADTTTESTSYTRLNGQDSFSLAVRKQSGTNTAAVAEAALAAFEETLHAYPDFHYDVVDNQADMVRASVNGALEEIVIAVLLAMLVVFAFFRNLRNTILTVIGLPIIMIGTFLGLQLFGVSINILSLLALSVSAGLVVDDAIVVRENIFRRLEQGDHPRTAASQGTSQVAFSVLAMTLTVIAVFLPAAFTGGTVGVLFKSFGVTVAVAMVISIIEAFTFGPMLASRFLKQQKAHPLHIKPGEEHLPEEAHQELGQLEHIYERLIGWTLRHRAITTGIVLIVVVAGIVVSSGIKFSFIPEGNTPQLAMSFELPPGTPLDTTDKQARAVEQRLGTDPDVEAVLTTVGGNAGAGHADFVLRLHDGVQAVAVQERLRPQFTDLPRVAFGTASSIVGGASTSVSGRPVQIQVQTTGTTESLAPVIEAVQTAFKQIPGVTDVDSTYTPGAPELQYRLRQRAANDYGLSNQTLGLTMRTLVDGTTAASLREGGESYDILVRLRPEDRQTIQDLQQVRLPLGNANVPISTIADYQVTTSPSVIRRADRLTEVIIGGSNIGRVTSDIQADMQARIDQMTLPPGVTVSFGGRTADQQESFGSLAIALVLSILLVYMVLASQFGSFLQPIVIMLAMPLSVVGAFVGLILIGEAFSVFAFIGLLMLMGMVVKNSILMVDFTNTLRTAGMDKHPALIRASAIRLRPILMTSLAVVLGNLPSVIGLGEGAELRRGLATVVASGMVTSTFLALVFIPVAYSLMDSATTSVGRLFRRKAQSAPITVPQSPADDPAASVASVDAAQVPSAAVSIIHAGEANDDGQKGMNGHSRNGNHHVKEPLPPVLDGQRDTH